MRDLRDRVCLVTGSGRRLGRAIAEGFGRAGARVAVHYHGSEAGARATAATVTAAGGEARLFRADLTDSHAPAALVNEVADSFGTLDVLVNSAAVMERTPLDSVTPEEWDATMALNARAPFFASIAAARRMGEGAVIVNLADLAAFETWPAYIPHGISKSAVVQMTRALARTLAPRVRVNAVAPGAVLLPDDWDESSAERLARTTPLGRLGTAADVVDAVLYLATAPYVTGETLIVDGGRHVRR